MPFNSLTPILEVENMDKTIDFYVAILDFKCIEREGQEWAIVQKDDIQIMFSPRLFIDEHPTTYMTGSLYIRTDDIDVIWQILKDKVSICYPIENFEYGMREFCIYDNNGYRLQFGQETKTN